jgi:outer membrane lipopolysaccharide assembly protein LptE/RlpB
MKPLALLLGLSLPLAACGYQMSPSPYGLAQPLTVNVPVAVNQSHYGDLGPRLTREVINRLDSSSNVTVRETAPATLSLTITQVDVSGGAWNPGRSEYDLPTASVSRTISLTVEAVLEKTGETGGAPARRRIFTGHRNFYVNENEYQTQVLEGNAFNWVLADLAQKVAQSIFAEF